MPERVSAPAVSETEEKALLPDAAKVPPLTVTAPLKVFVPLKLMVAEVPVSEARVLLPVSVKVVPEAAVTSPIVPPVPTFRAPAFKARTPSIVIAPETVSVPLPALVRPKLPEPSVSDPTERTLAETVAAKDCDRVAVPVPKLRSLVPVKVKAPFQFVALFAKVSAAPEELSKTDRAPAVSVPVPRASTEPRRTVPAPIVRPPLPVFVPESVSVPAPVLRTGAPKLTLPMTLSEEAPVPSTDQV